MVDCLGSSYSYKQVYKVFYKYFLFRQDVLEDIPYFLQNNTLHLKKVRKFIPSL